MGHKSVECIAYSALKISTYVSGKSKSDISMEPWSLFIF